MALTVFRGASAWAEPPPNDDFDSATIIGALPFSDAEDISQSTIAADDPVCGLDNPGGSSVWYAFTSPTHIGIEATADVSSLVGPYQALSVYTGTRGALNQFECVGEEGAPSTVRFNASAGETYFFMIEGSDLGATHTLSFSVEQIPLLPPPLELSVTIDGTGTVSARTGVVTIRGALGCSRDVYSLIINPEVRQQVGGFVVHGDSVLSSSQFVCVGGAAQWSETLSGSNGTFKPGRASVSVVAQAFDYPTGQEVDASASATVFLEPGPAPSPQPPYNDDACCSLPLLPGVVTPIDTTYATTGSGDPTTCTTSSGRTFQITGFSAWWALGRIRNSHHIDITLDSHRKQPSDFRAGLFVLDAQAWDQVACAADPPRVGFDAVAGHSYLVMVGSVIDRHGGIGTLVVGKPQLGVAVSGAGTVRVEDGVATLTGTVLCPGSQDLAEISGILTQRAGRKINSAGFFADVPCGPGRTAWHVDVSGGTGKYRSGSAVVSNLSMLTSGLRFAEGPVTTVHLTA